MPYAPISSISQAFVPCAYTPASPPTQSETPAARAAAKAARFSVIRAVGGIPSRHPA